MLSDAIRAARTAALEQSHGGRVVTGEEFVAQAAVFAAWETRARNLEETVAMQRAEIRAARMIGSVPRRQSREFGQRTGGRS